MTPSTIVRAVLPVLLLAGAAAAPQARAQPQSFYYVAATTGAWSNLPDMVPVVGDTHPLGWITFTSPGRSFTLTLDDTGTLTGATIPIGVYVDRTWTRACVPARTPTRLFGSRRGADVHILIDTAWNAELRCSGSGTTGTARVAP